VTKRGSKLRDGNTVYEQLKLPLDELLDAHPGELIPLEVDVDDIGGELLAILSKGLYTDPLHCIREYVQNAVDANARSATIKITGNSVHIFDNGDGMSLEELVQSRQFGLSLKSLTEHVGFRGIGIYSGFDLCNHLRITSKKTGDTRQHLLVFEFGAMKAQLEEDKQKSASGRKTSLVELLSAHTKICRIPQSMPEDLHFTHIEMQEISDVHIKKLSNHEELKHYMIRNLPIDFDEKFDYRKQINEQLDLEVPGYKAITLILQFDGLPDIIVTKPAIPHLQSPKMGAITIGSGKNVRKVAYYWACLNTERDRIAQNARFVPEVVKSQDRSIRDAVEQEFRTYEGFVYKMKGFTVGNRDRLRHCFSSKPQLYPWYTGEVYVLDTAVVPKADRDDFETNEAKRALELAVMEQLSTLEDTAENFQATGVADERVEKYLEGLTRIEKEVDTNPQINDYETYTRLNDILKDLRRQQKKASSDKRVIASDIIKRAERLQKRLKKETETPQPEAARRKRAANEETRLQPVQPSLVEIQLPQAGEVFEEIPSVTVVTSTPVSAIVEPYPMPVSSPTSPTIPLRKLGNVLLEAGWSLDGDCARLVNLLQASLESVLLDKALYQSVITDFEDRLNNGFVGE
jgi:hypothetical protein